MKKNKQIIVQNSFTEFLLYTTPNGKVKVEIYLKVESYKKIQLFPFWKQLPKTVKNILLRFIISMPLFLLAIVLIQNALPSSGFGQQKFLKITF